MKFIFVNDNVVKKKIEIDEETAMLELPHFQQIICVDGMDPEPDLGWVWDKGDIYPDIKPVTPRQFRQALILFGIDSSLIEQAFSGLPEPDASLARTEWEYATYFERRRPLVVQLGAVLGWTSAQLDDLWIFAGNIK